MCVWYSAYSPVPILPHPTHKQQKPATTEPKAGCPILATPLFLWLGWETTTPSPPQAS